MMAYLANRYEFSVAFSDPNPCVIIIDTVSPKVSDRASWFDLWAGGVAAYTMCNRYHMSGASIGLGKSAHLQFADDNCCLEHAI